MKGKIALGLVALTVVGVGTLAYSRLKTMFSNGGTFVTWVPGKNFYVFGVYPWDGEHLDHISELAGHLDAIYDAETTFEEIDTLNQLFYEE